LSRKSVKYFKMPEPKKNEKQNEYISRCVSVVMKEGKTQEQALGQCYGMWKQSKKRKKSKGDTSEPNFDQENDLGGFTFLP